MSDLLEKTLAQRGAAYGRFVDHADISQSLKRVMRSVPGWQDMPGDMRESLEMVAHKVARILNGNPTNVDSWHDIAGYAALVEKRLRGEYARQCGLPSENASTTRNERIKWWML